MTPASNLSKRIVQIGSALFVLNLVVIAVLARGFIPHTLLDPVQALMTLVAIWSYLAIVMAVLAGFNRKAWKAALFASILMIASALLCWFLLNAAASV